MQEFKKINWRLHDLTLLEPQSDFISEPCLADSLLYRRLDSPALFHPKRPNLKGLFPHAPYVPGPPQVHTNGKPSLLDDWTQHKCLQALQLIRSGKDPVSYTKTERFYLAIYHVSFKGSGYAGLSSPDGNCRFLPLFFRLKGTGDTFGANSWFFYKL